MNSKPLVSPRESAEIKALKLAIEDARKELRELKLKESLARRPRQPPRDGTPR